MSGQRRGIGLAFAAGVTASGATASGGVAQDRLVGLRAVGASATIEGVRFGGGGVPQQLTGAGDTVRVRSARQLTVPVTTAVPLGTAWTVDVTALYASGTVTYDAAGPRGPERRTATLSGPSDVRARATWRLAGDALIVTLGANAPTGRTKLAGEQLAAVRVLAAPALGLGTPPVGAGASGTVGLLTARRAGPWAVAAGASYELHGAYAPIGALVAGASTTNFRPGDVLRVSLGADRLLGSHRASMSVAGNFFGTDRLRGLASTPAERPGVASVRLGPELSVDAQMQLAVPGTREVVAYASNRWRARFARDGITVEGSSANYAEGGVRATLPITRHTDVVLGTDARWQSGLAVDDALLTAAVASGGVLAAVARRVGGLTVQPFARAQTGRVRAGQGTAIAMAGGTVGVTMLARF